MKYLSIGVLLLTTPALAQQGSPPTIDTLEQAHTICEQHKHVDLSAYGSDPFVAAKAAHIDPSRVKTTYDTGFEECDAIAEAIKAKREAISSQAVKDRIKAIAKGVAK